ncbi:MAG TPA: TylF/MycF/NovP-related O-methyltransferase [Solirubrobacteraceae bacterium]|nr:TylF/MycF/NovP-related O-methyltransferase [Solirubrobacteraceae bacterium]
MSFVPAPPMRFPTYGDATMALVNSDADYVRVATMALALQRVETAGVPGAIAEVGVWRGDRSVLFHTVLPDRPLHLFDTFMGFPDVPASQDDRFQDTSVAFVRERLPAGADVHMHPGRVPETLAAVADAQFAFVLLDLDRYDATRASLEFFYERLAPGAFVFVHDYNSPESDFGCNRALNEFLAGKPEQVIELADEWGSALFRRAAA